MAITFNEYQKLASRTANQHEYEKVNYAMGLIGETGELIDGYKKHLFHSHEIDKGYILKEAGDVLWYTSQLTRLFDLDLSKCFEALKSYQGSWIMEKRTLMVNALSLSNATGTISTLVNEHVFIGEDIDRPEMKNAFGFVLRNLFYLIYYAGLTIEQVAETNIAKLKSRYPEGFNPERSINRKE